MRLTVLGAGTCELGRELASSSYLVRHGDGAVMLDLGSGAWRRLHEAGFAPQAVQAVLLSHHHLDHMAELLPLTFALNYDPAMAGAHITLAAHREVEPVLAGLAGVFGEWVEPPAERLGHVWLSPGDRARVGPFAISTAAARHVETSMAYRLEAGGASLVYLGDSAATDELAGFARGAGLIIAHAARAEDEDKPKHMSAGEAGKLAAAAGAGALLLSHISSDIDPQDAVAAAAAHFEGQVRAAEDLMELGVGVAAENRGESSGAQRFRS